MGFLLSGESRVCRVSLRGEVSITTDTTIAQYLHEILMGNQSSEELGEAIHKCDSVKLKILWQIFFETGIHDLELMEERIYAYGSSLKEKDLLGREVFLALVSMLQQMKTKQN